MNFEEKKIDFCPICRSFLKDLCIECMADVTHSQECSLAEGVCNHTFHKHCIERWLFTKKTCPLDNKIWELKDD